MPPEERATGADGRAGRTAVDRLAVAARIIGAAGWTRPADAVLRETLRAERSLGPEDRRGISRAVFNYYRWFGWLDSRRSLPARITHALELADAFAERPRTFSDEKLVQRCVATWVHAQGEVTPAWARALQTEPGLWLRAPKGGGAALARRLGDCRIPTEPALADALEYRGTADLFHSREFHGGEFEIQDIASQAVGLICDPRPGETWWDACAGEGGKTLHLSDLMDNRGLIWASDRAAWRLRQLKRRAARAGCFNYRAVAWDGGPRLPTRTLFDGVLVDAPCAGLGTWQRNPQARWTTRPTDVAELRILQLDLLSRAAAGVKPGGRLVYAVCTLTRAETEEVALAFSAGASEFAPARFQHPWGKPDPEGWLWLWPQDTGGNGMFVAVWRRKSPGS